MFARVGVRVAVGESDVDAHFKNFPGHDSRICRCGCARLYRPHLLKRHRLVPTEPVQTKELRQHQESKTASVRGLGNMVALKCRCRSSRRRKVRTR
jgi:hypothetical protein